MTTTLREMEQAEEELPVDVSDAAGSQEQVKAAFRALVVAAFDDESLDIPATLARIKEILKSYEKLVGRIAADGGSDEVEPEQPTEETPESLAAVRAEMAQLREDLARLHRRDTARQVLESAGVDPRDLPPERLRLLHAQADEPAMQALVESWPPYVRQPRGAGPGSAAHPFREAARPDRYPQSLDEFVASVK